jgi:hypothetical protein
MQIQSGRTVPLKFSLVSKHNLYVRIYGLYILSIQVHCKKRLAIFPARKSLVRDIPAGDGKTANLFYSVGTMYKLTLLVHTVIHLLHRLNG